MIQNTATRLRKKRSWVACEKQILRTVAIIPLNQGGHVCDAMCRIEMFRYIYTFSHCVAVE